MLSLCNLLACFHGTGKLPQILGKLPQILIYTPVFWLGLDIFSELQQSQQGSETVPIFLRVGPSLPFASNWLESYFNPDGPPYSRNHTIPIHLFLSSTATGKPAAGAQPPNLNLGISTQAQIEKKFAPSTWTLNQIPATLLGGQLSRWLCFPSPGTDYS